LCETAIPEFVLERTAQNHSRRNNADSQLPRYLDLLPPGLKGYEHRGLGLTLELATFIEKFIEYGVKRYEKIPFSRDWTVADLDSESGFIMHLQVLC
jgi:hypothetical protein